MSWVKQVLMIAIQANENMEDMTDDFDQQDWRGSARELARILHNDELVAHIEKVLNSEDFKPALKPKVFDQKPLGTEGFKIGDRVYFKKDVDRFPQTIVKKGSRGVVHYSDNVQFEVKLDEYDESLDEWDNCCVWYGPRTAGYEEYVNDSIELDGVRMEED